MGNTIHCKFCGLDNIRKDGETRGKTRYECKDCGKHFTLGDSREKLNLQTRLLIALLYSSKSMSAIEIANYLGVSRVSVHNCIKEVLGRFEEPISNLYSRKVITDNIQNAVNSIDKKYSSSSNLDNSKSNQWTIFDLSQSSTIKGILLLKKTPKEKNETTQ